jgi:hypothetical protein
MNRSRKLLSLVLALALVIAFVPTALAANTPQATAADKLHTLELLAGVGTNADGSTNYNLDAVLTREAAITLIVNILGKYDEATSGTWETPFTDLTDWAVPFVGYAYANELTVGKSNTLFGSKDPITAKQYITFVLNALGYAPSSDFSYDTAWEKSDALGFTNGRYDASSTKFVRGDAIAVTYDALSALVKSSKKPLFEVLLEAGVIAQEQAIKAGLGGVTTPPESDTKVAEQIKAGQKLVQFGDYSWRVLNVEADRALLITEKIIEWRPYHEKEEDITWENCTLRQYLNDSFYNTFSIDDKSQILEVLLANEDTPAPYPTDEPLFGYGGNDTKDRIFLPSFDEYCEYIRRNDENRIVPTTVHGEATWWLRSPGYDYGASYISDDDLAEMDGSRVYSNLGVRPAFYINLKP